MLSQQTIDIIKSTVPVLEKYGEQITSRFYQLMFTNHPELKNIFNQTHQKLKNQPRALANAVYAAAKYIDRLEVILPAVERIFHKHRSVGVTREQYPIVGQNLLLAIKDVLGDAATDEILNAWAEAYGVIADIFIQAEESLYQKAAQQSGGWEGFRSFTVVQKVKESNVITSFYLKPTDGEALATYQPGQYISLKMEIPGQEYTLIRQYSLSDAPGQDYYRISVKREDGNDQQPAGIVSTYLHEQVQVGDTLLLSAPAGDFYLDQSKETPVVFISGGVGLTPLVSMLNTIAKKQPRRQVTYIHAALYGEVHAMDKHLQQLTETLPDMKYHVVYEQPTETDRQHPHFAKEGFIDLNWLRTVITTTDADFYFCGPIPFMSTIKNALEAMGIPNDRIHFEFFGVAGQLH
jgi:nitric oxide dioxygenase